MPGEHGFLDNIIGKTVTINPNPNRIILPPTKDKNEIRRRRKQSAGSPENERFFRMKGEFRWY
jgi:hypothetical protein